MWRQRLSVFIRVAAPLASLLRAQLLCQRRVDRRKLALQTLHLYIGTVSCATHLTTTFVSTRAHRTTPPCCCTPYLVQLALQRFEPGLECLAHAAHVKDLVQVLVVGCLALFAQAAREVVDDGHQEEAVELELHGLHQVVTDACGGLLSYPSTMLFGIFFTIPRTPP